MTIDKTDRRRRRSDDLQVALSYQLDHSRAMASLDALVLADAAGLVIAASGSEPMCEELGALAPIACRAPGLLSTALDGADVAFEALQVHGQQLFLAASGGNVAREAHLTRSKEGVSRILSCN